MVHSVQSATYLPFHVMSIISKNIESTEYGQNVLVITLLLRFSSILQRLNNIDVFVKNE